MRCGGCGRVIGDEDFATEVNPPGGYGRPRLLICDDCMSGARWDDWRAERWPNWPEPREGTKRPPDY